MIIYTHTITPRLRYIAEFIGKEISATDFFQLTDDLESYRESSQFKINYSGESRAENELLLKPHTLLFEKKIKEQRIIKDLEKKLAEKRYNQYQNEDEIEHRKDSLLDEVEKRLKQSTTETDLFTIKWKIL